jgi:transposase
VIPPKTNRKIKRDCDFALYRERNLIERFFNRIKHYRAIATATTNSAEIFSRQFNWSRLSSCSTEDRP